MTTTTTIDLSQLPPPKAVIYLSYGQYLANLLTDYTTAMREVSGNASFPYPNQADPAYQILSAVAFAAVNRQQEENEAYLATTLAYASGSDLDQLGANYGVSRLVLIEADNTTYPATPAVMESDEPFRYRIQLSFERLSTAGARGAYEYHVLSASAEIKDVFIDRPTFSRASGVEFNLITDYAARLEKPIPGDVVVTFLIDDMTRYDAIATSVRAALSPESVIPLTDNVHIIKPEIIEFELIVTCYFFDGPSSAPLLELSKASLDAWKTDNYKLGRDVTVSSLHASAFKSGMQRVDLSLKQDIKVMPWQAAKCTKITVIDGGRDE